MRMLSKASKIVQIVLYLYHVLVLLKRGPKGVNLKVR